MQEHFSNEKKRNDKMGKAELNKQNKRTSLLQAAFDLFVDKGFHQTTISEISKKSGLAKGTFYLYFRDKYDLRDQLVAKKSGQLLQEASEHIKGGHEAHDGFEAYLFAMIDYILFHLQKNKMLLLFISKNLSWGIFKHAVEQQDDNAVLETVYADYLQALEQDHISCKNPELMLFLPFRSAGPCGTRNIMPLGQSLSCPPSVPLISPSARRHRISPFWSKLHLCWRILPLPWRRQCAYLFRVAAAGRLPWRKPPVPYFRNPVLF